MAAKFVCGSALAVLASAGCIDDLEGVLKDGTATAMAIKGLVTDCKGDDRSKCQDDVGALLDSLDQLPKDIAPCTSSCGTHGPDCVAAIKKLGDDIGAIKEPAKDMADKCAGKDKSTTTCVFDGVKVGTDAAKVLSDVYSTITTCKKGEVGGCSAWAVGGCGVAAAAAAAACGGPIDPADSACILAALAAIPGCGPCVCSSIGCPSWCPCDDAEITAYIKKNSNATAPQPKESIVV